MINITYKPENVGKEFTNKKGKKSRFRKFHLTPTEMVVYRQRWEDEVRDIDNDIRDKVGSTFFNPYRHGIYYYQVQALFLLGANEWHSLSDIVKKLEEYTTSLPLSPISVHGKSCRNAWEQFRSKNTRDWAISAKDYIGRIQENYIMLQRLSKFNPYGFKLYQVCSAIDIKRVSRQGFSGGLYSYRLSTYSEQAKSLPIKDFSEFIFKKNESKYVNNRFIGTIITMDKVVKSGVVI